MNRSEKQQSVDALKDALSKAHSVVISDFRGLTVEQVTGIRVEFRKNACKYKVVKNTLMKRAIAGTKMEPMGKLLKGPVAIAYSHQDPVAPAKILSKFATDFEKLQITGGYIDGAVLDAKGVKGLATMKGKDELRAEFLALLIAPAQNFVQLLAAAPTQFMYVLQAREKSLQG